MNNNIVLFLVRRLSVSLAFLEEIFKVMAYANTFAYEGEPTDHSEMFYPPKAGEK